MSAGSSRVPSKRLPLKMAETSDDVQDWENHLILRVPNDAAEKLNALLSDNPPHGRGEEAALQLAADMRHATLKIGSRVMNAKIYDLPCISEVMKTTDKRNVFKVADLTQIMVCTDEATPAVVPKPEPAAPTSTASGEPAKPKKEMKQWQYPHGLTPPMKSVRRRRYRKTKKKKYMDAPEVEKELKRLLRADLDADSIRWEIVDDKKKDVQHTATVSTTPITTDALFGSKVSSDSEDDETEKDEVKAEIDDE